MLITDRGSKLKSASLLILGIEALQPGNIIPVSTAAVSAASSTNDALDRQRLGMALTGTVLYPIVVELVLKHIWEQERGRIAPHTHNVYNLFTDLRQEIQHEVKCLFDQCCQKYMVAVNEGQKQLGATVVEVDMANLVEALQWNEDAVKNLKYELTPSGKSVPTGIIWNSQTLWVLPGTFPNFAIELTRWATDRYPHRGHPGRR